MGLRTRVSLAIILSLILLIIGTSFLTSRILLDSFLSIEQNKTHLLVQRVQEAISVETENLSVKLSDWATWDDTYQFIQDKNQEYIESNLQPLALESLKLNLMIFANTDGHIVTAKGFDLKTQQSTDISPDILAQIYTGSPLLSTSGTDKRKGFILINNIPLLFASAPILKTDGTGPSAGTLIFGRYFDDDQLAHIANVTKTSLQTFTSVEDLPKNLGSIQNEIFTDGNPRIIPTSSKTIKAIFYQPTTDTKRGLYFLLSDNRDIYELGKQSITSITIALLVLGTIITFIVLIILERTVLSPLSHIRSGIETVRSKGKISDRIPTHSLHNEFLDLANSLNQMLTAIELTERQLHQRSEEMEKVNEVLVGRELKMNELKNQIELLQHKLKEQNIPFANNQ